MLLLTGKKWNGSNSLFKAAVKNRGDQNKIFRKRMLLLGQKI
jgi:hypothetical protein